MAKTKKRPASKDARAQRLIKATPINEGAAYLIRLAYLALRRLLQKDLAAHQVTIGVWYYLWALWEKDGLNQRELSERTGIREANTTVVLRMMERDGLVRRAQHERPPQFQDLHHREGAKAQGRDRPLRRARQPDRHDRVFRAGGQAGPGSAPADDPERRDGAVAAASGAAPFARTNAFSSAAISSPRSTMTLLPAPAATCSCALGKPAA